ncbi:MAG: hypothetical protein M1436_02750 [Acidobacteria bacterium]|nr:hypothetical protein [Acidobacteriota bacterium]
MKNPIKAGIPLFVLIVAPLCLAQTWEVGGAGSYGAYRNVTASSPAGSATVGFASSAGVSVVGTQNIRRYLGGEARYLYSFGGLKINDAATMSGDSHAFSYELLVYGTRQGSAIRPFFAAGAGAKLYRGTGRESAFQPLSNIALLTHTHEFDPLVSIGGGVKIKAGNHALLRLDFRDHTTPFPTNVITPRPPQGKVSGWLHDFIVLAGISLAF